MAIQFSGEALAPKQGGNPLGRKLEGVRVSALKKGQNAITFGEDVMASLNLGALPEKGLPARITKGTGKFEGKLLIEFGEGDDFKFRLRYVSGKRKTTAHIMSSAIPVSVSGKAKFKVYADDKAIVIAPPVADAAAAPAGDATQAAADAAAGDDIV